MNVLNKRCCWNTVLSVLMAACCWADGAPPADPAKPVTAASAGPKAIKLGKITVQGSLRSRAEGWQWFKGNTGDNTYAYSGNLFRLSFSQALENMDWQLEFAVPFLLGLPDNAISSGAQGQLGLGGSYFVANSRSRNSVMIFAKQGFIRFKRLGGSPQHSLRLGRFEFLDGSEVAPKNASLTALKRDRINQRLIGNFGWAHVQRSFDGAHYSYSKPSGNFTFVGGIPTRGVFQTDGWGENNTAFGYAAYTKPWDKQAHSAETRLLGIYYHDWRQILKTDSRSLAVRRTDMANIRIGTFGGHHLSAVESRIGTVDLLVWGVLQTGRWGRLDHRAYAVAAEAGIQPKIWKKLKPWVRGGYFNGSGDSDPDDKTHHTFFQILPTPRPFARFPFFDLMNTRDILGILILRPHKDVTISSEFHSLSLSSRNDLWYSGGGVFQPWTFGYSGRPASGARSLANLYDTSVEYRVKPNITVTGYLGYASGRAVMTLIYPKGKNGALGYLEMHYRF